MAQVTSQNKTGTLTGTIDAPTAAGGAPQSSIHRFANADGLRVLAILGVVICHVFPDIRVNGHVFSNVFFGTFGVDCFFVLSGFLLSQPYFKAIMSGTALPSATLFFRRRFFRIYPAYAVVVLLSMLGNKDIPYLWKFLWAHLLFVHGFITSEVITINGPLWTMAVDAQFYLALPALAWAAHAALRGRAEKVRPLLAALGSLVVLSLAWRAVGVAVWHPDILELKYGFPLSIVVLRNLLGVIGCFALGMLVGLGEVVGFKASRAITRGALALAALGFGFLIFANEIYPDAPFDLIGYDLIGSASAALILFATLQHPAAAWRKLVASRTIASLSALSYSVYLVHYRIFNIIDKHFGHLTHHKLGPVSQTIAIAIVTMSLSFALAGLIYTYVEQPFLKKRDANRELQPART